MVVYRRRLFSFPEILRREIGYPWLLPSILGVIFQGVIGMFSEAQLLTSAGYAALYPDSIMEDNNPIEQIVGVTLPVVNRAIEMGFADKNRIGVWGHSYGAYGVMALVTQTRAFRAAVANAPYGINMTSTYVTDVNGMNWCEGKQARNGGSLWEKRDTYIKNSPFFALDQVEAPVLIICGTNDVPGSMNSRETFLGLRRLGNAWKCENINVRVILRLIGRMRIPVIITKACSTGSINILRGDMGISPDHADLV